MHKKGLSHHVYSYINLLNIINYSLCSDILYKKGLSHRFYSYINLLYFNKLFSFF